ncbi:MAG: Gfo/Idh/MocA family oxidoreductase [Clostridia bacterium]|nr:Gfo/Idh/MocA family oxidoreductase [Clostridia bacterium]
MTSSKLRLAIVGLGNMGSAHMMNILSQKVPNVELTAVCDIRPDRLTLAEEKAPHVPRFLQYEEMLSAGLAEAVLIATPHYFHPPMAIAAFEAGLHVLTEKPAGVRVSDVIAMNEAADRSGKVFGIMFNQRTGELFQKAREMVQNGTLGAPRRLTWIITNWYRTDAYYQSGDWRGSYAGEGGGVLLNQAPHNLDLMQWIFGMPNALTASCTSGKYHDVEVEDEAILTMDYENGATAQFITTTGEYPGTNRLEIVGDRGKIVLEGGLLRHFDNGFSADEHIRTAHTASCGVNPTVTEYKAAAPERGHAGVLEDFAEAILSGTPPVADGREGIRMLSLANAAYLSQWDGRKVTLPLSEEDMERFNAHLAERAANSKVASTANTASPNGEISPRWKISWT